MNPGMEYLFSRGWTINGPDWIHPSHPVPFTFRAALDYEKSVDNNEKSRYPGGDTEAKDEVYTGGDKKLTFPHPLIGDLQGKKVRMTSPKGEVIVCRILGAAMSQSYTPEHLILIVIDSDGVLRSSLTGSTIEILPESKP